MARKATYDPDITKAVRNKALADILEVLEETVVSKKYGVYEKQMLLKLATTVLPRVNEHSGLDGGNIPIAIYGGESIKTLPRYDSAEESISVEAKN